MSVTTRLTSDDVRVGTLGLFVDTINPLISSSITVTSSFIISDSTGETSLHINSNGTNNNSILSFRHEDTIREQILYNEAQEHLEIGRLGLSSTKLIPLDNNLLDLGSSTNTFHSIYGNFIGSATLTTLSLSSDLSLGSNGITCNDLTISSLTQAGFVITSNSGVISQKAFIVDNDIQDNTISLSKITNSNTIILTNTAASLASLTVSNSSSFNTITSTGAATLASVTVSGTSTLNDMSVSGTSAFTNVTASGTTGLNSLTVSSTSSLTTLAVSGNCTLNNAIITGTTTLNNLSSSGTATLTNVSASGTSSLTNVSVSGTTSLASVSVSGNASAGTLTVAGYDVTGCVTYLKDVINSGILGSKLTAGSGISIASNGSIVNSGVLGITGAGGLTVSDPVNGVITLTLPTSQTLTSLIVHNNNVTATLDYLYGITTDSLFTKRLQVGTGLSVDSSSILQNTGVVSLTQSNGINCSRSTGAVTLSLDSSYSPTFAGLTLNSSLSFGKMSQTHDGSNGFITVDTGLLQIRPTDKSAMGTVLNPASYNSVIQMEDGVELRGGALQGSASILGSLIQLVPVSANAFGQLVFRGHPGNSFTVEFDAAIGDVTKVAGVWFFFNQSAVPSNMGMSTTGLGGYALSIDVFDSESTTACKLSLYFNGSLVTLVTLPINSPNAVIGSNNWFRVKMIFCMNQFWVTLNEVAVTGFYPYTDTRRSLSLDNDYYGFAAFNGSTTFTYQDVRNIRICKSNGGPITPMNDIATVGIGGKMAVCDLFAAEKFSVTDAGVATVTGSMVIKDTNNSAQGTVLNPSAYNSVLLYEDFKSTTPKQGGVLQGLKNGSSWAPTIVPTIVDDQLTTYVRLTDNTANTYGQLVYKGHPGNAFTAEFEARIADLTKADGIWFFFNRSSVATNATYGGGTFGGYEIAINEYNNNNAGGTEDGITVGTGDQLMIYFNGTLLISSAVTLVPNVFMRIKIIFAVNQFWVSVNEVPVTGMYPFTDSVIRSLSQDNNYYGVAAWSGGSPTYQDVANFRIAKSNGGPIKPGNSHTKLPVLGEFSIMNSNGNYILKKPESGPLCLYYKTANNGINLDSGSDTNHQIIYDSGVDGPVIRGNLGGRLATSTNGNVLQWTSSGIFFDSYIKIRSCGATLSGSNITGLVGSNYTTTSAWSNYVSTSKVFGGCTISSSGNSIIVPVAGPYAISCSATFKSTNGDRDCAITCRRNGDYELIGSASYMYMTGEWQCVSFKVVDEAPNANDTYTIYLWMNGTGTFNCYSLNFTVHSV